MTTLALAPAAPTRNVMFEPTANAQQGLSSVKQKLVPATVGLDDEELLATICLGKEWAIELFYERYHRYAYALAYRILQESTLAEDIVQEVFLAVWRKAASYQRQQGTVLTWFQAIVHHRTIDKVRSASYRDRQRTSPQEEDEREPAGAQPDVWEEAWRREQRRLLNGVLARLPYEQRQVIELAYFGGYTHAEIAEKAGIPLGTVKGRMRLGLHKMRSLLQERGLDTMQ